MKAKALAVLYVQYWLGSGRGQGVGSGRHLPAATGVPNTPPPGLSGVANTLPARHLRVLGYEPWASLFVGSN